MKTLLSVLLLCGACLAQIGIGSNVGIGFQPVAAYQSFSTATQIHAAANHWGNSGPTHTLLDTTWVPQGVSVSKMAWYSGTQCSALNNLGNVPSVINVYDAGYYCIAGSCQVGRLYAHTGPLLACDINPPPPSKANAMNGQPLVADASTVCQSYPCFLPPGIYSVSSGSTEAPVNTMTIWGESGTRTGTAGGADFHTVNSGTGGGHIANADIGAYVPNGFGAACYPNCITSTPSGGNTIVTLYVTMINGQNAACSVPTASCSGGSFASGMTVLVMGSTSGTGGISDACNGRHVIDTTANIATGTGSIQYTIPGTVTCTVEGKQDGTQSCNDQGLVNNPGVGCVSAGLPPTMGQVPTTSYLQNGFFSYPDGTEASRTAPAGTSGPQSGSHSIGIVVY